MKIFPNKENGDYDTVEYTEHYPPDTSAGFRWLYNRQSQLWRERVEMTHTGPDGGAVQVQHKVEIDFSALLAKRIKQD